MTKTSYLQNETQQSIKLICWVNVKSFVTAGRYLLILDFLKESLNIHGGGGGEMRDKTANRHK